MLEELGAREAFVAYANECPMMMKLRFRAQQLLAFVHRTEEQAMSLEL